MYWTCSLISIYKTLIHLAEQALNKNMVFSLPDEMFSQMRGLFVSLLNV